MNAWLVRDNLKYTVIDNFFENANEVRQYALSKTFAKIPGDYPGLRCFVEETKYINKIKDKVKEFFDLQNIDDSKLDCMFQLIPSYYEEGWVHRDSNCHFAGVIYLSNNAPLEAGTSLCSKNDDGIDEIALRELNRHKNYFYANKPIDKSRYRKIRDYHNSKYTEKILVDNVFNRLLLYKGNVLHKERMFFGDSRESSRLTLVFFYRK